MRAVFGLVLIFGMGLAGFAIYMAQGYFQQQNNMLAQQRAAMATVVPTVDVFAVNRTLEFGDEITTDDVILIKYAEPFLPDGVFRNQEDLFPEGPDVTRIVVRQMEPNEPILASKVTEPGEDTGINARLGEGMRAMTIEVDVTTGVSGFLAPRDHVDVFWTGRVTDPNTGANQEVTQLIGASVEIIAVDQTSDARRTGASIARTITVEVTPVEAGNLTHAQATGRLSLTLVGREDETLAGTIEVDQASLLGLVAPIEIVEEEAQQICTIRTRRGAEVVEIPIPCTN